MGVWQGKKAEVSSYWLRWWDESGNLLLWGSELVEQERQRAEQAIQQIEQTRRDAIPRLQALGLSPEQIAEALSLSVEEVENYLSS